MMFREHWDLLMFGADVAVLYLLHKIYKSRVKCAEEVEKCRLYEVGDELEKALVNAKSSLPYACVEGLTQVTGKPLQAHNSDNEQGVIQRLLYVEHKSKRSQGYWSDVKKVLKDQTNYRPFHLAPLRDASPLLVDVTEPLSADYIQDCLQTIHDQYLPTQDSLLSRGLDRIFGEVTKGFQETEKMLGVGVPLMGIGKLTLEGGKVLLEPPSGADQRYILTTMSKKQVIKSLEGDAKTVKVFMWIMGLVGVGLLSYWIYRNARQLIEQLKQNRLYAKLRQQREAHRRRQESTQSTGEQDEGADNATDNCVICLSNPREVVILECGHICLCGDCVVALPEPKTCPICRGRIARFVSTYMS